MKKKQCSLVIIVLVMIALGCVINVFVIAKTYYKDKESVRFNNKIIYALDDDLANYIKKSMEVGGNDLTLASWTDRVCEVISGDAALLDKCKLTAKKKGVIRVKVTNPISNKSEYYEVTVTDPNNIGDNNFSGNGNSGQTITNNDIDPDKYTDAEVWNMTVGDKGKQIGGATALTYCELVEGAADAVELGGINGCTITPKKAGTVIVKYANKWGDDPLRGYYKIVVTDPNLGTSDTPVELDPNYKYKRIGKCDMGGYVSAIIEVNGVEFCVTPDSKYVPNIETTNVACKSKDDELWVVSFKSGGTLYKGYGCRRKISEEGGSNVTIPDIDDCTSLLGNPENPKMPAYYIVKAFDVVKYVAIILLIVLSILDFVGAAGASNEDALKKATNKVIVRLILCVIIFLLPTLISFILKYLNNRAIDLCGL